MKNAMIQQTAYRENTIPHIRYTRHYGHIEPCSPQIHVKSDPAGVPPAGIVRHQMFVNGAELHFPFSTNEIDIPLQRFLISLKAIHHVKLAIPPHLPEPENHIIGHANIPGHVIGSQIVLLKLGVQPPFGSQHINVRAVNRPFHQRLKRLLRRGRILLPDQSAERLCLGGVPQLLTVVQGNSTLKSSKYFCKSSEK